MLPIRTAADRLSCPTSSLSVTAGIPLLFLDYAIGHRYRGSAPLSVPQAPSPHRTYRVVAGDDLLCYWHLLRAYPRVGHPLLLLLLHPRLGRQSGNILYGNVHSGCAR